ncbi:GNAT family N-acetyltransferase [Gracilibacillus sp. YIM 98692]|uniref:GNAT family N-acetyltransferase n=1 Tax=Gracilibacillus sp. YIM 98692 TaxID=2663532 RepID=UPI0013D117E7|nr:GNAT family N-acetyltransferase [Gracilibacillus sp. YIM 98692]
MDITIAENEKQKEDAYQVRFKVFVEEQKVPENIEIDELEEEAIHFVGYNEDKPIAASRMRLAEDYGKMERICVLNEFRAQGYGKDILLFMEKIAKQKGIHTAKLNAQTQAEGFYQQLGYQTTSEEFLDANIPHVTMTKEI